MLLLTCFRSARLLEQHHDLGGGFLDRAAGDIDDGTADAGEKAPRLLHFLAHQLGIDVMGFLILAQQFEPVAANFDQTVGVLGKADKKRFCKRG